MNIAVLGTGSVGQTLAVKLHSLDHSVFMGTRNVEKSLAKTGKDSWGNEEVGTWIKSHPEISLVTFKKAVQSGNDLIVFAMNGGAAMDCLGSVGEDLLGGKVMIDITNPLDFSNGFPPSLTVCNTDSLAEQIQRKYPSLRVVKSLNTMSHLVMVDPGKISGDHSVFMSGNDHTAKSLVASVLASFGWKEHCIIDLGDISTARGTEMVLPLWLRLYGKINDPYFNFHINSAQAK